MRTRGLFITVEGGEGVGKSTSMAFLEQYFVEHGIDVLVTREPGGTHVGEEVRELLLRIRDEPLADMSELLLMFAARAQHISEVIAPALTSGRWVLCDRFTDATYAYQSGGRGVPDAVVQQLETLVQGDLRPDFTLLLDAPVEVGMARARGRGELDRIEQEAVEFFERVRARYLALAESGGGRYKIVDASLEVDQVQEQLQQVAGQLLQCWQARQTG